MDKGWSYNGINFLDSEDKLKNTLDKLFDGESKRYVNSYYAKVNDKKEKPEVIIGVSNKLTEDYTVGPIRIKLTDMLKKDWFIIQEGCCSTDIYQWRNSPLLYLRTIDASTLPSESIRSTFNSPEIYSTGSNIYLPT